MLFEKNGVLCHNGYIEEGGIPDEKGLVIGDDSVKILVNGDWSEYNLSPLGMEKFQSILAQIEYIDGPVPLENIAVMAEESSEKYSLRKITQEELNEIVAKHEEWVKNEIIEAHEAGPDWADPDWEEGEFSVDFSRMEKADLSCCDLRGLDLSEAALAGISFAYSDLRGADLSGSDMSDCDFTGANCSNSNMSGSQFGYCVGFDKEYDDTSYLDSESINLHFENTKLENVSFDNADISNVVFKNCILDGSSFDEVLAYDTTISNCSAKNCAFSNWLEGSVEFRDSDFTGSSFENVGVEDFGENLSPDTYIKGCKFNNCSFENVDFNNMTTDIYQCELSDSSFDSVVWPEEGLRFSKFMNAEFLSEDEELDFPACVGCDLANIELISREIPSLSFEQCTVNNMNLSDCNIEEFESWAGEFKNIDFSNAKISEMSLNRVESSRHKENRFSSPCVEFDNVKFDGSAIESLTCDSDKVCASFVKTSFVDARFGEDFRIDDVVRLDNCDFIGSNMKEIFNGKGILNHIRSDFSGYGDGRGDYSSKYDVYAGSVDDAKNAAEKDFIDLNKLRFASNTIVSSSCIANNKNGSYNIEVKANNVLGERVRTQAKNKENRNHKITNNRSSKDDFCL